MFGPCKYLLNVQRADEASLVTTHTFPQPGNSHAWTRLPFFALLILPVGVDVGVMVS